MRLTLNSLDLVYFCTGARNHDLLKFFKDSSVKFEYDERMASFKALGSTKADLRPVAICTTSGTAVSQCISAMLEAQYSNLPLVLITGDRPKKMHGTGAPQTIDHEALTKSVRGSYIEVNLEDLKDLEILNPIFPVHINVLVDDTKPHEESIDVMTLEKSLSFLKTLKKPLILLSHENKSLRPLAQKLLDSGVSFYAETMSCAHDLSSFQHEKEILSLYRSGEFDSVIRIGHTPLTKIWRFLETSPLPVMSFDDRGMSGLSFGKVVKCGSTELLKSNVFEFFKTYQAPKTKRSDLLNSLKNKYPRSEISTFMDLQKALPENATVFLGNSLVVRFFELTQTKNFRIFGNRGVNGIDGQLASAIGIAATVKETVYCILGDITTFYDLSSMQEMPENLKLIIINNKGGRIFDMLKLDKRIVLQHENSFKDICQGFHLSYAQNDLSKLSEVQVLELHPIVSESEAFLSEWSV